MKDIRFYDFDFNLLYILPEYALKNGYSSMNATQELNGPGSFELVFYDEELKKIIEKYTDNILINCEGFQGFVTGYRWDAVCRVMGMHLNGLLHRSIIPQMTEEYTGDAETLARQAVSENILWLSLGEVKGFSKQINYKTEKPLNADEYIQNLLALNTAGYKITADIINKQFVFSCIKPVENTMVLSEGNKNAYNIEETYDNKELAYSGWYQKEQPEDAEGNKPEPVWTYITLDDKKTGIYNITCVLNAQNQTDAINELKLKKPIYEMVAETQNIKCNIDYHIGDIVRVRNKGVTVKKIISGVNIWNEHGNGEEPILTTWEEETNG